MGPTDPNRYYLWSGYTGNDGKGGGPVVTNDEAGYSWTTYPERLDQAGVSWKVYQDTGDGLDAHGSWGWTQDAYIGNYGDNSLLYFDQYRNAVPGSPLYDNARTGTSAKTGEDYFAQLKADVLGGKLPQVSWIAAPEAFTEHPNWPVNYGAWYIAQVLDALTADPEVWSRTALLVTYDENDGFFDHVVPPYPPSSPAQGGSTVEVTGELLAGDGKHVAGPYGLGQRVPMLVLSPWSTGGWVCSEVFDHTSIIRFIERRFGVHEPNISPWRRTVCGDLTAAFDFTRSRPATPGLPDTAGYAPPDRERHPDYVPVPPPDPDLPVQERGVRPARALPYDLSADAHLAADRLRVTFASHGKAGAHFYVTSVTHPDGPWTYTAAPRRTLTGGWDLSAPGYDFTVHGPNGFFRRFAGRPGGAGAEVTVRHEDGLVCVEMANECSTAVHVTVADAYRGGRTASYRLRPGACVRHTVDPRHSNGWYDLSVASDHDSQFLRRMAGHAETGRPSTSDPAIITA
jgi:phospholipase C